MMCNESAKWKVPYLTSSDCPGWPQGYEGRLKQREPRKKPLYESKVPLEQHVEAEYWKQMCSK